MRSISSLLAVVICAGVSACVAVPPPPPLTFSKTEMDKYQGQAKYAVGANTIYTKKTKTSETTKITETTKTHETSETIRPVCRHKARGYPKRCKKPGQHFDNGETPPPTMKEDEITPTRNCPRNKTQALTALGDEKHAHIILMRHGITNDRDPIPVERIGSEYHIAGCTERHRRLKKNNDQRKLISNMASVIKDTGVDIIELYSSETCRAQETVQVLIPELNLGSYTIETALNPPLNETATEATVEAMDWINNNLSLKKGQAHILVSHNSIIPSLVRRYHSSHEMKGISETEAVIMRKTDKSYKCIAIIPKQE